eukprot:CAMPEP_0115384830 /NCGR_PEP_ID=MMETSP0271-20121206/7311_1 /TAXON_ID=71861 /ORGANISM="Scrippsiella trochoidea, Strain CCMP3099" /LENGTH=1227 /DNA_ID=CAMNT_0002808199 /DNA_START=155 /DNA_END=3837 /DNA_ORIENTATION=-
MPPKNNVNPELDPVIADPANRTCADCDAKAPRWASVNLGILVCIDCSGAHRNLGTHISVVKSVTLDKWQPKWIATVGKIGNEAGNAYYEDRMDSSEKPRESDSLEKKAAFIRKKYENKQFVPRNKPSPSELLGQGRDPKEYCRRGGRDRSASDERRPAARGDDRRQRRRTPSPDERPRRQAANGAPPPKAAAPAPAPAPAPSPAAPVAGMAVVALLQRCAKKTKVASKAPFGICLTQALEAGDARGVLELFMEDDTSRQEDFLRALKMLPGLPPLAVQGEHVGRGAKADVPESKTSVQQLLDLYLKRELPMAEGYSAALHGLLAAGALREAMQTFAVAFDCLPRLLAISLDLHRGFLQVLGVVRQLKPAFGHIRSLMEEGEVKDNATSLFNAILQGVVQSGSQDAVSASMMVDGAREQAGVPRDSETLALLCEVHTYRGSHGYIKEIGRLVVDHVRMARGGAEKDEREDKAAREASTMRANGLGSDALLAVSMAHLRSGNLELAYRFFIASQLLSDDERTRLHEGRALVLVSEMLRAFALSGQALRMLRLLKRAIKDNAKLPPTASSVSIAGSTSGRTLATVWLEPLPELLRRRSVWSSTGRLLSEAPDDSDTKVMCAEQWDWDRQEAFRHEATQWYPYLAPDTKMERAWLWQMRGKDLGSLGLARDWVGESPAATAARERLGEEPKARQDNILPAALKRSLRLLNPAKQATYATETEMDKSFGIYCYPEPRTWRMHHADAVHRCFLSPALFETNNVQQFRQVIEHDTVAQRMSPGFKELQHSKLTTFKEIKDLVLGSSMATKNAFRKLSPADEEDEALSKLDLKRCLELLKRLGLDCSKVDQEVAEMKAEGNTQGKSRVLKELTDIVNFAKRVAENPNEPAPLTGEEFRDKMDQLGDVGMHQLWKQFAGGGGIEELLGADLVMAMEKELTQEMMEDSQISGSAADELRLALEIMDCLTALGRRLSLVDRRVLMAAAHATGDSELAGEVLRALAKAEPPPEAGQGPAARCLADAMELGGWDRSSAEAFLAGQKPVPERVGGPGLGSLQTRLLDPLKGFGGNDKYRRAQMLTELMSLFEERPEQAKEIEIMYDSSLVDNDGATLGTGNVNVRESRSKKWEAVVTEADLLRGLIADEDESQRMALEGSLKWLALRDKRDGKADIRGLDQTDAERFTQLGIPTPKKQADAQSLASLMHKVSQKAERLRRMAAYEVKGRNIAAKEVPQASQ